MSRPIEGLDSLRAALTLRIRRTLVNTADASRPRKSSDWLASELMRGERRIRELTDRREANPFARRCKVRSVRAACRLSRPSMGRDTLTLPKQTK